MQEETLARLAEVAGRPGSRVGRAAALAGLIRDVGGARWVGLYSVAGATVTNDGWSGPAAPAYPTFPSTKGLTGHAIATGAIAVSNDVANDPRYLTNQDDSGSELIVPIVVDGRVVGTLDVESDAIGAFGGAAITTYEAIADVIRPLWQT